MMAEIFDRATGLCKDKGGSMRIADLEKGMPGANGIVGGGPPLICGAAVPYAPSLEAVFVPTAERVEGAVRKVCEGAA